MLSGITTFNLLYCSCSCITRVLITKTFVTTTDYQCGPVPVVAQAVDLPEIFKCALKKVKEMEAADEMLNYVANLEVEDI